MFMNGLENCMTTKVKFKSKQCKGEDQKARTTNAHEKFGTMLRVDESDNKSVSILRTGNDVRTGQQWREQRGRKQQRRRRCKQQQWRHRHADAGRRVPADGLRVVAAALGRECATRVRRLLVDVDGVRGHGRCPDAKLSRLVQQFNSPEHSPLARDDELADDAATQLLQLRIPERGAAHGSTAIGRGREAAGSRARGQPDGRRLRATEPGGDSLTAASLVPLTAPIVLLPSTRAKDFFRRIISRQPKSRFHVAYQSTLRARKNRRLEAIPNARPPQNLNNHPDFRSACLSSTTEFFVLLQSRSFCRLGLCWCLDVYIFFRLSELKQFRKRHTLLLMMR